MEVILNENRLAGRGVANREDDGIMVNHGWFVTCLIDSLRKTVCGEGTSEVLQYYIYIY
jgi:hypothetical protein